MLVCVASLSTRAVAAPALKEGAVGETGSRADSKGGRPVAVAGGDARVMAAGTRLYDNTGNPANTYYSSQGGAEAIDDLHFASGGSLDTLAFEYYDPAVGGTLSATVNLYANPGGLDLGTTPLAGPYVVGGLPRGRKTATIPLPQSLGVGASIWMGVQFTSTTAGLILNSVPSVGSSHDLYLENGGFYWFGGSPKANFGIRLVGNSTPLAVGDRPEPNRVALDARPNPFAGRTTLDYTIDRRGPVRLDVLDVSGRRVRSLVNAVREPGHYTEFWSGQDAAGRVQRAGVYFVRLESATKVTFRRMVLTP